MYIEQSFSPRVNSKRIKIYTARKCTHLNNIDKIGLSHQPQRSTKRDSETYFRV